MDRIKNQTVWQGIAFLLVLLAFPLLTYGTREAEGLAWAGMGMVVLGFLIPPVARFALPEEEGEEEGEEGDEE
ncbi:MAG: hypothetical protein IBX62_03440 [Coriobacteriia bacterium]|nr:hypothetical protein [Coriobacteriia bacterium]